MRTRGSSGDSKNYCVRDFVTGPWHEMCHGKFIPQLLLPEQKGHQLNNDLIQTATSELDFLKKVITRGDL